MARIVVGRSGPQGGGGRSRPDSLEDLIEGLLGQHRLLQTREGLTYVYNGRCWERLYPPGLEAMARQVVGRSAGSDKINTVKAGALSTVYDPDWRWGYGADHEVACFNGMLDVLTGTLRPHTPADALENTLPVVWNGEVEPAQVAPLWHAALETWFTDEAGDFDESAHDALQDWFGYVLLGHARFKKALMMVGPGDSGKSQLAKIMAALVTGSAEGGPGVCSLDPHLMDDPQALAALKGARLNLVTELSETRAIAASGFKKLVSTQEPVYINEKFERVETYVSRAKHAFCANQLPRVTDRTKAVINRFLVLPMMRPVPKDQQIENLAERIAEQELEGVVAWGIVGARRLIENGGVFTEPRQAQVMLDEIGAEANPFATWAAEGMVAEEGARTPLSAVVEVLNKWWGGRPFSVRDVGNMARDAGYQLRNARPRDVNGNNLGRVARCLLDVRLVDITDSAPDSYEVDEG